MNMMQRFSSAAAAWLKHHKQSDGKKTFNDPLLVWDRDNWTTVAKHYDNSPAKQEYEAWNKYTTSFLAVALNESDQIWPVLL